MSNSIRVSCHSWLIFIYASVGHTLSPLFVFYLHLHCVRSEFAEGQWVERVHTCGHKWSSLNLYPWDVYLCVLSAPFVDPLEFFSFCPQSPWVTHPPRHAWDSLAHPEIPHSYTFFCGDFFFSLSLSHPCKPHQEEIISLAVCIQYTDTFRIAHTHTLTKTGIYFCALNPNYRSEITVELFLSVLHTSIRCGGKDDRQPKEHAQTRELSVRQIPECVHVQYMLVCLYTRWFI